MANLDNPNLIAGVSGLFAALGDPSRLKLLRALLAAPGPLGQGEAARTSGLSQANASRHLAHLARVGLVTRETRGTQVRYAPVTPLAADLCDLVCGHVAGRIRAAYTALD